jgi:hypothetical protein
MHRLRRQLAPHGITIESIWGHGYHLDPENRARLTSMIAEKAAA